MAKSENLPFDRGTYDTTAAFLGLLGRTYEIEDIQWVSTSIGARPQRTGKMVTVMLVRNDSGFALLPKRLVALSVSTAGDYTGVIEGYSRLTAARGFPVDEYLPSAGVPDGAYFYIVVKGPALVLTPLAGSEFNGDISLGTVIVALTAVTTGATTAGRVAVQNITGSSQATDYTFAFDQIQNKIGRALTAKTTGNTNADLLVDVQQWF